MLDPQVRKVFLDALTPPEGFVFDEGIGTTYSLDLISLLSVPLAFTQFAWEDAKGELTSNPILLLEALRRHAGRMTVFCQAGRIALPTGSNVLLGYLEESVVGVTQSEGVFHPKVWALRYLNDASEVHYRLVCLTRNLTDDQSWDLSLVLDGPLMERKKAFSANHPLGDLFATLPKLALQPVSDIVAKRVERISEELRRVDFSSGLPDPFETVAFHALGIEGHRSWPLPRQFDRTLVISPFVDASIAKRLAEETSGSVLVSRAEELDSLSPGALVDFAEVLVIRTEAEGEFEPPAEDESEVVGKLRGLHAKLYVCDNGWNSHLFVGSANATAKAFKGNVEFLVELIGKKSKIGVEQCLAIGPGEASLRSLLEPYEPPAVPVAVDPTKQQLDDLLNAARNTMAAAGWHFVISSSESASWTLRLVRKEGVGIPLPQGVEFKVWPITLPESAHGRVVSSSTAELEFGAIGVATITSFLGCEAKASIGGSSAKARFVLNLPIEGGPPGRREAILRSILDDPNKILRFLQFLLDDGSTPFPDGPDPHLGEGSAGRRDGPGGFVLLEALLRALVHQPERLDEVDSLLREFGSGSEANDRLPKGLLEIWPAIWNARETLRT
jgi:hypothetical protein